MVLLSYAICVCTESLELENLLNFIRETRCTDSETVVLVDTSKVNEAVDAVIKANEDFVRRIERPFDGDFAEHKNYLGSQCKGRYVFNIDADEIPQEALMHRAESIAKANEFDAVYVPRINVCPGYTERFVKKHGFNVNEAGWINWPDFQGRIYRRETARWEGKVHEKLVGEKCAGLPPQPIHALWHIKSTAKQDKQNNLYDKINGAHTDPKD